jgi:hypothetical protein
MHMAKTTNLDQEASVGERPRRQNALPPGAPNSAILPDPPAKPGNKSTLETEREARVPPGGLPDGIPHGDRNPGAKPQPLKK